MCYLQEMSGVEAGVDRIVDQIVNPDAMEKEVESVIYRLVGQTIVIHFVIFLLLSLNTQPLKVLWNVKGS